MSSEMPDSTKELLNAHHASILRELDRVHSHVTESFTEIKTEMGGVRTRLESHDSAMAVLKWAYAIGVVIIMTILGFLQSRG